MSSIIFFFDFNHLQNPFLILSQVIVTTNNYCFKCYLRFVISIIPAIVIISLLQYCHLSQSFIFYHQINYYHLFIYQYCKNQSDKKLTRHKIVSTR